MLTEFIRVVLRRCRPVVVLLLVSAAILPFFGRSTTAAPASLEPTTPSYLLIPSLGVEAAIEPTALAADGGMPAPRNGAVVAWYDFSAGAGEPGNMVVAGHRDWQRQRGVFYGLGRLVRGDEVWVLDRAGVWHRYDVEWSISLPDDDQFPLVETLGPTAVRSLTLITCSGRFDQRAGSYVERRLVRAWYALSVAPVDSGVSPGEPEPATREDQPASEGIDPPSPPEAEAPPDAGTAAPSRTRRD